MNAPAPIPTRVRRLVPVLASPVDGEVVATARAIGRTLNAAGLDFHALAAAIPIAGDMPTLCSTARHQDGRGGDEGRSPDRRRGTGGPTFSYSDWRKAWVRNHGRRQYTDRQEADQRRQMRFCERHSARLGQRERAFIRSILKSKDGLSFAQADWLADLADRLEEEVRAQ